MKEVAFVGHRYNVHLGMCSSMCFLAWLGGVAYRNLASWNLVTSHGGRGVMEDGDLRQGALGW